MIKLGILTFQRNCLHLSKKVLSYQLADFLVTQKGSHMMQSSIYSSPQKYCHHLSNVKSVILIFHFLK